MQLRMLSSALQSSQMLLQEGSARSQERGSLCLPHSVPNVVVCVGVSLGVCVCVLFVCVVVVVVCECSVGVFFGWRRSGVVSLVHGHRTTCRVAVKVIGVTQIGRFVYCFRWIVEFLRLVITCVMYNDF